MTTEIIGVRRIGEVTLESSEQGNVLGWADEYIVRTSTPTLLMWTVMQNATVSAAALPHIAYTPNTGLPIPKYTVSTDGVAVCKGLHGRRDEKNPNIWIFSAEWSSNVNEGTRTDNGQPPTDPATVQAQRKTLYDVVRRPRTKDYTGRPYINATGSLFVPGLEVDEEISRWDWTQYEPVYTGAWTGATDARVPVNPFKLLDQAGQYTSNASLMSYVVPPGIWANDTYATMVGVTDNTVAFFNGAVNTQTFQGCPPFTLKLEVRDSTVGWFFGKYCRKTDYTLKYDYRRWTDKPVNAGPYFLAPQIKADGTFEAVTDPAKLAKYDYIYYTKDEEDDGSNISQEEAGPLGDPNATASRLSVRLFTSYASYDAVYGVGTTYVRPGGAAGAFLPELGAIGNNPFAIYRKFAQDVTGGHDKSADGGPFGGYRAVKTANKKWTVRALRPKTDVEWPFIEYLPSAAFDFRGYLRVRYTQ